MSATPFRATFVVQLKDTQNATWQGNVVWAEKNMSKPFRSALELIKLIDSAVVDAETPADEEDAPAPQKSVSAIG